MDRRLQISGIEVGDGRPCFFVAEIGSNHQGSQDGCKRLLEAAKASGTTAVKLQKRDLPSLFTKAFASQPYLGSNSFGDTYLAHREALELSARDWRALARFADDLDLILFATAFDLESARFLVDLGMPALKIASGDALNWPLLDQVSALGPPLIVSTGGLSGRDVDATHRRLTAAGAAFALLQCTSIYPCPPGELDLEVIASWRGRYPETVIGYSGHEEGILPSIAAVALGASIVERHFTTDRTLPGADHALSLLPAEFAELVSAARTVEAARGLGDKRRFPAEARALEKLGKKLVAIRGLSPGHVLHQEDIEARSPGDGLSPHLFESVVGRVLQVGLDAEDPITWEALEPSPR